MLLRRRNHMRTRLLDGAEAGVSVVVGSLESCQQKTPAETPLAVVAVALSPLYTAAVNHSLHPSNPIKPSNALYKFRGILKKKKKIPVWLQETAPACSPQPALCPVGHSGPNLWLSSFIISPIFTAPLPWDAAKSREWITQSVFALISSFIH